MIEQISQDLRREFPDMKGLSRTNLLYMRAFAEAWPDESIVQQVAGQIPWFHNCVLLDKVKTSDERLWYARQTVEYGWSRNVLVHQIESRLYARQGKAVTNFDRALPTVQSDLARELLKDPSNFEFLTLRKDAAERGWSANCSTTSASPCFTQTRSRSRSSTPSETPAPPSASPNTSSPNRFRTR